MSLRQRLMHEQGLNEQMVTGPGTASKSRRTNALALRRCGMSRYRCAIKPSAPFAAVRHPVARPVIAMIALAAFLGMQYALPLAYVYAQAAPRTNSNSAANGRTGGAGLPVAGQGGPSRVARPSQRGVLVPSDPTACGGSEDCKVSMRALDLRRVPTEHELRRAGQLGGALNPIKTADVVALSKAGGTPKQIQRLQQQNLSFGQAIQEWNKHNYKVAARLFEAHLVAYPDSPWAGESMLHLGCDARYNGRFAEAAARYNSLLKGTSSDPRSMSYEVHQKAKLRWADLDIGVGKLDEAQAKLTDLMHTDRDWRRRTWAHFWLHQVGIYKHNARDLRACGTQALSVILASLGKQEAASRLARLRPTRSTGFSLAELEQLAAKNGVQMRGFRATAPQLAELPTPFLIHYDFNGLNVALATPAFKANAVAGNAVSGAPALTHEQSGRAQARLVKAPANNPFHFSPTVGHFLVVKRVDKAAGIVHLYDPQERRLYALSYSDLTKEWSGTGLVMVGHNHAADRKIAALTTSGASPAAAPARLAWLSDKEEKQVVGGCCGVARAIRDLGDEWGAFKNWLTSYHCTGRGAPQVSINRMSLNMFIKDTPIGYHNALGPDVNITMGYNSLDALSQNTVLGNKWVFNYGSYAVEDTEDGGGVVTVFMPDGAEHIFYPDGNGGYTNQVGVHDTLRKTTPTHYELSSPTGETLIYDIPAGTDSLQAFLVEVRDRWGYSLHMGYTVDSNNLHLTSIIDALGRVTQLSYDANGHIVRADDPFGRHATFRYDSNGNMIEVVDMEGNAFEYTYDSDVLVTRLNTAQGLWQYKTLSYNSTDEKGAFVTTIDPRNQTQQWYWSALPGHPMVFFDQNQQATQYYINDVIDGKGVITQTVAPNGDTNNLRYDTTTGLPSAVQDARGQTTQMTYNAMGQVISTINPEKQITRFNYDAGNGIDLLSTVNPQGRTLVAYQYNGQHQPTLITDAQGHQMQLSYTPWGALSAVTDNENHHTVYNYDGATKQLLSVSRDGVTLGSYTYDAIGHVRTKTNSAGLTTTYDYNELDNPTKVTYADGTYSLISYACCGLPGVTRDRAGRLTYYDYDEFERLTRVQDAAGHSEQMDYDNEGNLAALTDAQGHATYWQYDNTNRVTRKTYPNGSYESYSYDTPNNIVTHRDVAGQISTTTYDDNGNLIRVHCANTPDVTFAYDALNRPYKMTDGVGTTLTHYDALGRVDNVDGPWANDNVTYHYDDVGRRDWMQINGTDQASYHYDALGRMDSLTSVAGTFNYSFVGNTSSLSQWNLPNGTRTGYAYDSLKRLTGVQNLTSNGTNISTYGFGFDSPGYQNRTVCTWMEAQVGTNPLQHTNYGYDPVDQLTSEVSTETPAPFVNNQYAYDWVGNRTLSQRNDSGGMQSAYTTNALNQYSSITSTAADHSTSTATFNYDANGNLRGNGAGSVSYKYDGANRLVGILQRDSQSGINTHQSAFVYNGLGRKVIDREFTWNTLTNAWNAPTETHYIYDGLNVVQERDGNNSIIATYTRSGNIGGLLARSVVNPQTGTYDHYYYHYDGQGNVAQLTDANQQVVAQYVYDAFGNTQAGGTQAGQPYRYQTKAYHVAFGLYDFGLRYYSPGLGRWLNRDPIQESGGANLYAYAGNSPQRYQDAYGAFCMTGWQILATGTAAAAGTVILGPELLTLLPDLFLDGAADAGLEDAAATLADEAAGGDEVEGLTELEPGNCFVAGTLVTMGDGTTKPIEQVKVGEQVLSRDLKSGQTTAKRVEHTSVRQATATLALHFSNGERIECSTEHPFYVADRGFVPAKALGIGTSIVTRAGPNLKVTQIERRNALTLVYNFTVTDFHTYFVSNSQLWVHNACQVFYRTMSPAHYDELLSTGRLPSTAETFISPSQAFSSNYSGVTVEFTTESNTTSRLLDIGVRDMSNALGNPATGALRELPVVSRGWTASNAFFKAEGAVINIGLGQGSALELFNDSIMSFIVIP